MHAGKFVQQNSGTEVSREGPLPTFDLISCIESKLTQMSAHPAESYAQSLKSAASSTMHI